MTKKIKFEQFSDQTAKTAFQYQKLLVIPMAKFLLELKKCAKTFSTQIFKLPILGIHAFFIHPI